MEITNVTLGKDKIHSGSDVRFKKNFPDQTSEVINVLKGQHTLLDTFITREARSRKSDVTHSRLYDWLAGDGLHRAGAYPRLAKDYMDHKNYRPGEITTFLKEYFDEGRMTYGQW